MIYESNNGSNKQNLILKTNKEDTTFAVMMFSSDGNPYLASNNLKDEILYINSKNHSVFDYENIDTIKFYIKQAIVKPFEHKGNGKFISDYKISTVTLVKEPLDSILYIKKKGKSLINNKLASFE